MAPKRDRKRQHAFNLLTRYDGDDEVNTTTVDDLKRLYNERDQANNMHTLLAMKSNADDRKFMMLMIFNDKLKGL